MTVTPPLTGQDIGRAHYATRAVLTTRMGWSDADFTAWVALNQLDLTGPELTGADLVDAVVAGLRVQPAVAREAVAHLQRSGLVDAGSGGPADRIAITPAGAEQVREVRAVVGSITQRLYGGLPADDLAVARRVLAEVTARAEAELAG
jgi:hypothetical protein